MTNTGTHDKFETCMGCPHREPKCHMSCEGYKYRRKKLDERNLLIRKNKHERGTNIITGEEEL